MLIVLILKTLRNFIYYRWHRWYS